jgi:hypothetical protein
MELEHGHALVVIMIVTTNGALLLVKVDVRVGNPLIYLVLGNLEPSMAAWLELQQALFREFVLMKSLFHPLMNIEAEQLFPCRALASKSAHPLPNCGCRRWLLCATV